MPVDLTKSDNGNSYINAYEPDVGIKQTFFRADNRLNRKRYLKRSAVIWLISLICDAFAMSGEGLVLMLAFLIIIVMTVSSIMLSIRRLHDCDKSGYWYFLALVPIVNLVLWLYLLFQPGTAGENKYGPDPLKQVGADFV